MLEVKEGMVIMMSGPQERGKQKRSWLESGEERCQDLEQNKKNVV